MQPFMTLAALACLAPAIALAEPAGYKPMAVEAPHHGRDMLMAVWFPAEAGGRAFTFGENGVFHGVTVVEEAPVAQGKYPVVLLSHGLGGNIRSLAWLASGLAEQGALVVSVNHPNSTWGDFDLQAGLNHGTRAQDLSVALDEVLADPDLAPHLDLSRVMAAGFSFGGWTALSIGGVTGNLGGYVAHCAEVGAASSHCADLDRHGVSLAALDPLRWNASYKDPRITHVAAIDPAFTFGLTSEDAAQLPASVRLIGLGAGADRHPGTDFDASGFAAFLPEAEIVRMVPASHFTMLPLCKPMGAAILAEEGDDPVCTDPEGADRARLHDDVLEQLASDLGL